VEEAVERVAERFKRWRSESGLSLQELANRSGVSPSTIHKIEHGQTVPTIAVVLKIVSGLGRHATELFDETDPGSTTTCIRADERREFKTTQGALVQSLAGSPDERDMGFWRVVHPPGFNFGERTLSHLHGEVIVFLEAGALQVRVADEEFEITQGDSLHFKASSPYAWSNTSEDPAVALILGNTTDSIRPALEAQLRKATQLNVEAINVPIEPFAPRAVTA
jgi:transcriptional regulator with XRE-family HTH domain